MKQRVLTGFLFTVAVLAFIVPSYFNPIFIALFLAVVMIMSMFEMKRSFAQKNIHLSIPFLFLGGLIAFVPLLLYRSPRFALDAFSIYALSAMIFALFTIILIPVVNKEPNALRNGLATASVTIYLSFPVACSLIMAFSFISVLPHGWYFFVLGLFAPWISDVFAYFTGVLFGKHKIIPHISPKKTWEGCIGGAIGCTVVVAFVMSWIIYPQVFAIEPFWGFVVFSALMGLVLSIFSQLGDWFASALKRWMGIKDFGTLLPGHGGILDRFDSAFFTLPVAFGFAQLIMWLPMMWVW